MRPTPTFALLALLLAGLLAAVPLPSQAREITVIAKEFQFDPSTITLKKGEQVTVLFKDKGTLSHNFTVPGLRVKTETIQSGQSEKLRFIAAKAGAYTYLCTVPGHEEAGMKGTLTVR